MLDRADRQSGYGNPRDLPPLPHISEREMRLALKAGLVGLHFSFEPEVADQPGKKIEISKRELAALDHEIDHVTGLVSPYKQDENPIRYLRSLESAIGAYESHVNKALHYLSKPSVSPEVASYKSKFEALSRTIADRKSETLGQGRPGKLFYDRLITTYNIDGEAVTRQISAINWEPNQQPVGIYVVFRDGQQYSLLDLQRASTRPVKYAPDSVHPEDIKKYVDYTFPGGLSLERSLINQGGGKYCIELRSKNGNKWTIDCKATNNAKGAFGPVALIIDSVINWQQFSTDPELKSFRGERVTRAQLESIAKYIDTNQGPIEENPSRMQRWKKKGMHAFNSIKSSLASFFS